MDVNGWTKHLVDGSQIVGSDTEVQRGLVSWRKTQHTEIAGVDLKWGSKGVAIKGFGDYWQADDMMSSGNSPLILIRRRIQKRIESQDLGAGVIRNEDQVNVVFLRSLENINTGHGQYLFVGAEDVGKWLTLEITDNPESWFRIYLTTDKG